MSTVAVLGGGIAGLTSAFFLSRLSLPSVSKIVVIEGSNRLGGWIQTEHLKDGTILEGGPRSFRYGGKAEAKVLELVEMLDLKDEIVTVSNEKMRRRFFIDGAVKEFPKDFDKWKILKTTMKGLLKDRWVVKPMEDESVESFLYKRFGGSREIMGISDAMFRGIFASSISDISYKFSLFGKSGCNSMIELQQQMKLIKEELKKHDSELVRRATEEKWQIWNLRRGTGQLVEGLAEALLKDPRVEIKMDTPCQSMELDSTSATLRSSDSDILKAEHVISTVLSKNLGSMLPAEHEELSDFLCRIPAVSVIVVNVVYDQDLEEVPQGFGHLLPSFEDPPVLGVVYDSRVFPDHGPINTTRLTVMMGGAWMKELKDRVGSLNDESLIKLTKEVLHKHLNITASPAHIKVRYQMDCIPLHAVGHNKLLKCIYSYINEHQLPLTLSGCSYREIGVTGIINDSFQQVLTLQQHLAEKS
ncbi:protoporphyrinogen oxidase-like [Ostrea edulis]|uniref:protoporphyrinogen oxidase-like n=1 Tax=Ostrea edulis TaxID=37623 RepID=UPI0024AEA888|nr:protoporphyrinogen oxidase-like [Ostrea edulis]